MILTLVPITQIKRNNLWKKDETGKLISIYKTTMPSTMLQNSVYQEIKGVGTITKSSNFENNGRESLNTKFFEIESKYSFKINNFLNKNLKLTNE